MKSMESFDHQAGETADSRNVVFLYPTQYPTQDPAQDPAQDPTQDPTQMYPAQFVAQKLRSCEFFCNIIYI